MLTEWEAVNRRISCRAYTDRLPDAEILDALTAKVEELNRCSGLRFELRTTPERDGSRLKLSSAMFSGTVRLYAVLIGGDDPLSAEKVGYYGQELVLYATRFELGTCWVAGTYDREALRADLRDGETVRSVVPIGYPPEKMPLKQKMIRASIRKKDRALEQFIETDRSFSELPEWMRHAVEAVKAGPSAVNRQPVDIVLSDDGTVRAKLRKSGGGLQYTDLGIAKKQFEVGAAAFGVNGQWAFGDGGAFTYK